MLNDVIHTSPYANSHGADGNFLGAGAIYYMIPYALKAQVCVCLGSGAGFVPKLMVEAQKSLITDSSISNINVSLVDADIGPWGRPEYEGQIPGYSEIKIIKMLTDDAVDLFESNINYLHVDADHTYDQVLKDLNNYGSKMAGDWAITIHDTFNNQEGDHPEIGSYQAALDYSQANDFYFTNFHIGCGTGLIMPKRRINGHKEMGILSIF